jgi:phenylalanyl-tRNA synthetase beta chain
MPAQITTAITVGEYPDPTTIRNKIGDFLAANGCYEMMAVSLSESRYYQKVLNDIKPEELVYINNTSNVHLNIMRPDMLISGLEAVLHNQNRQQSDVKLFEFGKTYRHGEGRIVEQQHLCLFMVGQRHPENWLNTKKEEVSYYSLKTLVTNTLSRLGLKTYQETAIQQEPFSFALRYHRGQQLLVEFGKVDPLILKKMDIRGVVFYADFNLDSVLKAAGKQTVTIEEINKFPSTRRDLALVIDNSVKFQDIVAIARKAGKKLIKDINLFDVYENAKQLGEGKKSYAVSFLFEDPTKNLQNKEVDKVMNKLMRSYKEQLGAEIRGL